MFRINYSPQNPWCAEHNQSDTRLSIESCWTIIIDFSWQHFIILSLSIYVCSVHLLICFLFLNYSFLPQSFFGYLNLFFPSFPFLQFLCFCICSRRRMNAEKCILIWWAGVVWFGVMKRWDNSQHIWLHFIKERDWLSMFIWLGRHRILQVAI